MILHNDNMAGVNHTHTHTQPYANIIYELPLNLAKVKSVNPSGFSSLSLSLPLAFINIYYNADSCMYIGVCMGGMYNIKKLNYDFIKISF